jgi:hypothetical protein
MSLDSERPEEVRMKLPGKPKQHLIEFNKKYYSVSGHSDKQAKFFLALKEGGGGPRAKEAMRRMKYRGVIDDEE